VQHSLFNVSKLLAKEKLDYKLFEYISCEFKVLKSIKILLLLFAIVFAVGASVTAYISLQSYMVEHLNERDDVSNYDEPTIKRDLESCLKREPTGFVKLFYCVVEAARGDEISKKDKYDLKAQQEMAEWAYGMFLATIFTILVGIIGVVFVWLTLLETRKVGQAQTRAYFGINTYKPYFWNIYPKVGCSIHINLKNTGTTPALMLGYSVETEVTNSSDVSKFASGKRIEREIGPDVGFTIDLPFDFTFQDRESASSIIIIIRYCYSDIFDEVHWRDVKYVSYVSVENIPGIKPKFTDDDVFSSHCLGFVESNRSWLKEPREWTI